MAEGIEVSDQLLSSLVLLTSCVVLADARARDPNNLDQAVQPIPSPHPSHSPQSSSSALRRFTPPPMQLQFIQFIPCSGNMNKDDNSDNNRDDKDGHGYGHGDDGYCYDSDDDHSYDHDDGYDGSDDGGNSHRRRHGRSSLPGG